MPPTSAPRRLLAVDDNRVVLQVVSDYFGERAWDVSSALDGAEALAAARGTIPDAVVSDVLMPVMDGWTFYARFRELPGASDVPFVFLTVETQLEHRLRGLRAGADDYLVKPFAVEELFARVERLAAHRRRLASPAAAEALLSGSVQHLAISDLLQILALNSKDGTVQLRESGRSGVIEFEEGVIVHASCGPLRGPKALFRMLGWGEADFRVVPRSGPSVERTVDGASTAVIMDGLVSLDEWTRWRDRLPAGDTVLAISGDARSRLQGAPISPPEFDVLSRAKRGVTVVRALDEIPRPDAEIAEAICSLIERGALVAALPERAEC